MTMNTREVCAIWVGH